MNSPHIHELKTWPAFFRATWDGRKTFDIRLNDRDFEVGDSLLLREYDPEDNTYTGRSVMRRVVYITEWNQKLGYIVMGLAS
jgi:hypothetical protein